MSKTVKEALKEAQENIDKKDYKTALKCCKRALNVDNSNYKALVYYGKCSDELELYDQAIKALKKATEAKPEQLTAWQGISSHYEKKKDMKKEDFEDLAVAYDKILKILEASDDMKKYYLISEKLVTLHYEKLGHFHNAIKVIQDRVQVSIDKGKEDKVYYGHAEIVKLLNQQKNLTPEDNELFKENLYKIISDESKSIQNLDHMKMLMRVLYDLRQMEELLKHCFKMSGLFPENSYPLEWICKVYMEYVTGTLRFQNDELEETIETHFDKLLSLNESSNLGKLAKAAYTWKVQKDLKLSRDLFKESLDGVNNPNFYGLYILCQCYVALHDLPNAETSLKLALASISEKVKEESTRILVKNELEIKLANILYAQGNYERVVEILDGKAISSYSPDLKIILLKTYAQLGKQSKVNELVTEVDENSKKLADAIILKKKGNGVEAVKLLEQVPSDFESILLRAEITWSEAKDYGQYDKAHVLFLQAAKADPNSWVPFYYLGDYYQRSGPKQDFDRARKCFEKSFSLNPHSKEAGSALSDVYFKQERFEDNLSFLLSVTSGRGNDQGQNNWAHLRLGMHYLATDDPSKAIVCLQTVLRTDANNLNAWESLADAYFNRGSYTSALKAYDKVLQLHKVANKAKRQGLYAELQIATIKLKLGHFREAKVALREILQEDPKYVPALKVMSECLLNEARDFLQQCIDKNVVDNCQEAINVLVQAITESPNFSCLWKLLGEALLLVQALPNEVAILSVPSMLVEQNLTSAEETNVEINKLEALKMATRALSRSLKFQPLNVSCWHDLALSYHYQIIAREGEGEGQEEDLKDQCFHAIRKALALKPKDHTLWNILGVFGLHHEDMPLAQHAFIRSITLLSNSVAWSNLGIMYFMQGRLDLANKAFQEAQNQDPAYLQGWIGQALLAETASYEDEAIDLFRHCTFLGNGLESAIGYGHWICKTLQEIEAEDNPITASMPIPEMKAEDEYKIERQMNNSQKSKHNRYCVEKMFGVSVAVDCLERYVARVSTDACALNMLGILLERQRHFRTAKRFLTKALQLQIEIHLKDQVLHNLARVLYKLAEFGASVKCYQKIAALDFYGQVGLALSAWKSENFQLAYSAYGASLPLASTTEQRSHILAAMATIAYKFQGADPAKTLLFQSCQQRPPSLQGVLALCVLGMKQKNPTLVQAALSEMDQHRESGKADIVAMKALVMTLQGNPVGARQLISKAIHSSPEDADLWKAMAIHLLNYHRETEARLLASAANCAQKSAGLCQDDTSSMMSLVGFCLLNGADKNTPATTTKMALAAKRAAIKAIHCYPQNLEPWSVLLAAEAALDDVLPSGTIAPTPATGDKGRRHGRLLQNAKAVMHLNQASQQQQPNTQPALLADWIKNYG